MLYLSKRELESIGKSVSDDFESRCACQRGTAVDIDLLAEGYLDLSLLYARLLESAGILGLTTTGDISLELHGKNGAVTTLCVPKNSIVMDESLSAPSNRGRRRFTLAHECAHQILARLEEAEEAVQFRKMSNNTAHHFRTPEDFLEWQANTLAAALLMPQARVFEVMTKQSFRPIKLTQYGGRFNTADYRELRRISQLLGVSIRALTIRLRELYYIEQKPASAFFDPLEYVAM
jgi:hypothetical protein